MLISDHSSISTDIQSSSYKNQYESLIGFVTMVTFSSLWEQSMNHVMMKSFMVLFSSQRDTKKKCVVKLMVVHATVGRRFFLILNVFIDMLFRHL